MKEVFSSQDHEEDVTHAVCKYPGFRNNLASRTVGCLLNGGDYNTN